MDELMESISQSDTSETVVVDNVPIENIDDRSGYFEETEVETNVEADTSAEADTNAEAETNGILSESILENLEPNESTKPPEKLEKIVQLPLTRIKNLIKLDPDVNIASQDAVVAIAKAAELFIHMLGKEAYKFTKQNKKKTIQKKDIIECIAACESLCFLEGTLKDD